MIPLSLLFKLGGRLTKNLWQAAITLCRKRVSVGSVVLVLALAFGAYQLIKATHKPEDLTGWTKKINDTTTAVIASQDKTKLPALVDAAKTTHGTLVAGLTVKTKPDTVFVPIKEVIQSTVLPDSTREATLQQDTAGYQIRITAVAPPFPQPLKLGYSFITPEFHPQIGFEKVGNSYAAIVSWAGKKFTVDSAFFLPAERRVPSWALTGQVGVESDFGSSLQAPVVALQLTKTFSSGLGLSVLGKTVMGHHEMDLVISHKLWSR